MPDAQWMRRALRREARFHQMLSNESALLIVLHLCTSAETGREESVQEIAKAVSLTLSYTSQILNRMRDRELVRWDRVGKTVVYTLEESWRPAVAEIMMRCGKSVSTAKRRSGSRGA